MTHDARPLRARGFTLIEVMLVMLISGFVLVAAFSTLRLIDRSEASLARRYDDLHHMARTHEAFRRAMISLRADDADPFEDQGGAGQGGPDDGGDGVAPDEEDDGADDGDADTGVDDQPNGDDGEEDIERSRPLFTIGPVDADEAKGLNVGDAPWRVEVALSTPPIGRFDATTPQVRGAFEILGAGEDWRIVWTPIEPEGPRIVLADHLLYAAFAVLTKEDLWTDLHEARNVAAFPRALRLAFATENGSVADWLFEPAVAVGGAR